MKFTQVDFREREKYYEYKKIYWYKRAVVRESR